MPLRTIIAKDMPSALAKVHNELGQDVVILHTRLVKRGGVWGMFQKPMVEVTAADKAMVIKYRKQRAAEVAKTQPRGTGSSATGHATDDAATTPKQRERQGSPAWVQLAEPKAGEVRAKATATTGATSGTAGDLIRKTYAAAMVELQKQHATAASSTPTPAMVGSQVTTRTSPINQTVGLSSASTQATAATVKDQQVGGGAQGVKATATTTQTPMVLPIAAAQEQLTAEMRTVQRMVGRMMRRRQLEKSGAIGEGIDHQTTGHQAGDLPDPLLDQYLAMMKQEVAEEIAEEILGQVRQKLPDAQVHDAVKVKAAVLEAMAKLIPVDPQPMSFAKACDGRMRVIALIGPTGVGKTTTVAKLAANLKLRQKKNIGLVTIDTYRIAAVEQLRTYAQIIGVPLEVASSPSDLADALARCRARGCEVVLMDTAGRSQRDDPKLEQLAMMLRAAQPDEVHLVLSSTCTQSVLEQAVERFSRLRTDRIIFTKLDEAVSFGVLLNVSRKLNKRLSFVTTGQEVPHDIEPGRAQRLAALVLGEGA